MDQYLIPATFQAHLRPREFEIPITTRLLQRSMCPLWSGITKAGNGYLRQLLVECANHVVGPRGKDSALRQWGLNLGARGGSHARRRAVVAVARKLAVLLHRIWMTQEVYQPFYAVAA